MLEIKFKFKIEIILAIFRFTQENKIKIQTFKYLKIK
jgi:hypothetical protein